jgi:protein SCO1/2
MSIKNLVVAILLGAAFAGGIFLAVQRQNSVPEFDSATVLPAALELPAFQLLDQRGQAVSEGIFRGQWDLVFFGFTQCPDICPLTLRTLVDARQQLAELGQTELPRVVLVSVDPGRDTVERMAAYVNAFSSEALGLTGELPELRKLTGALGIYFEKSGDGEHYVVDHSAVVIALDPEGRFRALFSTPHKAENFVHDLPLLMAL